MKSSYFDSNKPIHLARRDANFERAVEILSMPVKDLDTHERIEHIERIVPILTAAEHHASFAAKSQSATDKDRDFRDFLKLILDNVVSIGAMMQHQNHLEAAEGFLCQFLKTTPEQCTLPAMHYRRRADDLQAGAFHLLRLALSPFRELQHENRDHMTSEEKTRYTTAHDMHVKELQEKALQEFEEQKKEAS